MHGSWACAGDSAKTKQLHLLRLYWAITKCLPPERNQHVLVVFFLRDSEADKLGFRRAKWLPTAGIGGLGLGIQAPLLNIFNASEAVAAGALQHVITARQAKGAAYIWRGG